jgi:D-glycero-alpha-D-manno-heptose-7-phosphate kinase
MYVTRTPLRVTLGGGGTDLSSYYRNEGGFIFAMALDKYIYLNAHRPTFRSEVTLYGFEPETVAGTADLKHELTRAALTAHGFDDRFEMSSIGDIAGGTGLGSSSCFLVGLLRLLHAMKGETPDKQALAEEACTLEIDVLGKGIGKQDQYMAAFGGLTRLDIAPDGQVKVSAVAMDPQVEATFLDHTHIYYTGLRRDAAVILDDQNAAMLAKSGDQRDTVGGALSSIKELGYRILDTWQACDLEGWGHLLHEHWLSKKQLSSKISWPHIDDLYDYVRANLGVTGGKVIGAGGGGFLMLFTPRGGGELEAYMASQNMPRLPYRIDRDGASVIHAPSPGFRS